MHLDREAFETAQLDRQIVRCPNCGNFQEWTEKDVDPASFE